MHPTSRVKCRRRDLDQCLKYRVPGQLAQCEQTDDMSEAVGQMKHAIYEGGLIACSINNDPIKNYSGGVFDDNSVQVHRVHVVEVVGWGVTRGWCATAGALFW